jgi:hypothetical protein
MPTRRDILKSVAATLSAWLLPHRLFATTTDPRFHFIQIDSQRSWPTANPVAWALKNQGQPILERAAEGLAKLTVNDGNRVVRLIVRRCDLKLLELRPDLVVVHHWGHHVLVRLPDRRRLPSRSLPGQVWQPLHKGSR